MPRSGSDIELPAAIRAPLWTAGVYATALCGEQVELLALRALHWPRERTVFVADVHLGKAAAFRAGGVPLPRGSTAADLDPPFAGAATDRRAPAGGAGRFPARRGGPRERTRLRVPRLARRARRHRRRARARQPRHARRRPAGGLGRDRRRGAASAGAVSSPATSRSRRAQAMRCAATCIRASPCAERRTRRSGCPASFSAAAAQSSRRSAALPGSPVRRRWPVTVS